MVPGLSFDMNLSLYLDLVAPSSLSYCYHLLTHIPQKSERLLTLVMMLYFGILRTRQMESYI